MHLPRQTRAGLALGALVLLSAACNNDDGVGPDTSTLDASYRLVTANSSPPPILVFSALGGYEEVVGARLSLESDRSASVVFERRATTGNVRGPITRDSTPATYTLSGTRLILTFAVPGSARTVADTGTIDNTLGPAGLLTINMNIDGRSASSSAALSFIRDDARTQR